MDAVSYSHSAKQAQRIEKFIENPDSTSGIVTVPKTIPLGETITIPTGRVAVLPNIVVDGDLVLDGDIFIPTGSSVDFSNGIKVNGTNIALSIPTSYHLLSGNLSVDNTVLTNGFGVYLYTGNTTTPASINLGMDITSQWGNTADETYGYLIKIKSRSAAGDWTWVNSVRGITKYISSNTTAVEGTDANMFTLSTVAGVTTLNIGTSTRTNTNGVTYVVEVYQTTHRKTGVTNQGKAFTEHYNPDTGFTIEGYEGSGLSLHEIPHSLDKELNLVIIKNLSATGDWVSGIGNGADSMYLNLTNANTTTNSLLFWSNTASTNNKITVGAEARVNASTNQYILFGYRNSYFDESGKLIGNFEIGLYQGTANATGLNKVLTKGKPAWIIIKRLDGIGDWLIYNNMTTNKTLDFLYANLNNAEVVNNTIYGLSLQSDGFTHVGTGVTNNASGGQYLYMIVYDNYNGSGKSKYYKASNTANVQINNGIIPLAHGIDSNGSKNSIVVVNETITGVTYTEGKNYLYRHDNGYGVKPYKERKSPSELVRSFAGEQPDYYDVESNKWFNCDAGAELVTNGTFENTIGWVGVNSTLSVSNNTLIITPTNTTAQSLAETMLNTIVGKKYTIKYSFILGTAVGGSIYVENSSGGNTTQPLIGLSASSVGSIDFIAQSTITYLKLRCNTASSQTTLWDNISVFQADIVPTTEITESRNYMNHIVHADADGGVLYVEELPKIEYKNAIKAEEYLGKNACTAWVNFDGTTTPPTIRDSYNVSAVVRTAAGTGAFDIYFKEPMDNTNYGVFGASNNSGIAYGSYVVSGSPISSANDGKFMNKVTIGIMNTNGLYNPISASIQIFGGRN